MRESSTTDDLKLAQQYLQRVLERASSEGHWYEQHATAVLVAAYRALLGREPDEAGLRAYSQQLTNHGALEAVLASISASREHHLRVDAMYRQVGQGDAERRLEALLDLDRLTRDMCERPLMLADAAPLMDGRQCLGQVLAAQRARSGRWARKPKILLFGAFGNGNLGDAYQAQAMEHHVRAALTGRDVDIYATSALGDRFPFERNRILPSSAIESPETVNCFDALLIGGGGLLAHPHDPLSHVPWLRSMATPIALVGVGASEQQAPQHRWLIEKAWFVSGRDPTSVATLSRFRDDVSLVRDPILSLGCSHTRALWPGETGSLDAEPDPSGTVWVLKHASNEADEALLAECESLLSQPDHLQDEVLAIEPHLDATLTMRFANRIRMISDASELVGAVRTANRVVTMRYHGAIYAALANRPFIGCSQPKIQGLTELGSGIGSFANGPQALRALLRQDAPPAGVSNLVPESVNHDFVTSLRRQLNAMLGQAPLPAASP